MQSDGKENTAIETQDYLERPQEVYRVIRVLSYQDFLAQIDLLRSEEGLAVEVPDLPLDSIRPSDVFPTSAAKVKKYTEIMRDVVHEPHRYPTAHNGVYQPIFVVWTREGARLADGSHRYESTRVVSAEPDSPIVNTIYARIIFGDENTLLHHRLTTQPASELRSFAHTRLLRFIIDTYEGSGYNANLPFSVAMEHMQVYERYVLSGGKVGASARTTFGNNVLPALRRTARSEMLPWNENCSDDELWEAYDTAYRIVFAVKLRVEEVEHFLMMRRMLDPGIVERIRAEDAVLQSGEVPYSLAYSLSTGIFRLHFPAQRAIVHLLRGFASPFDGIRKIEPDSEKMIAKMTKLLQVIKSGKLGQQSGGLIQTTRELVARSFNNSAFTELEFELRYQAFLEELFKVVYVRGINPTFVSRCVELMRGDLAVAQWVPEYLANGSFAEYACGLATRQREDQMGGDSGPRGSKNKGGETLGVAQPLPEITANVGVVISDGSIASVDGQGGDNLGMQSDPLTNPAESSVETSFVASTTQRDGNDPRIARERERRAQADSILRAISAMNEETVHLVHARMLLVTEIARSWVANAVLEYCIEEELSGDVARTLVETMAPIVQKAPLIYVAYVRPFSGNGQRDVVNRLVKDACHKVMLNRLDPLAVREILQRVLQDETVGMEKLLRVINRGVYSKRKPRGVSMHDIAQGLQTIAELRERLTRLMLSAALPLTDPEDPGVWRLVKGLDGDDDVDNEEDDDRGDRNEGDDGDDRDHDYD